MTIYDIHNYQVDGQFPIQSNNQNGMRSWDCPEWPVHISLLGYVHVYLMWFQDLIGHMY